jgi:hypothetical protein
VGLDNNNTTISNSYATGAVTANANDKAYAGGLVGRTNSNTISNSYATGNVSSSSSSFSSVLAGGLVGGAFSSTITNSYATGNVSSSSSSALAGGLVGVANNTTITNCFQTDKQVTQEGSQVDGTLPAGVIRISAAGQAQNAFTGWAFGTDWASFTGNGWPTLLNVGVKP